MPHGGAFLEERMEGLVRRGLELGGSGSGGESVEEETVN